MTDIYLILAGFGIGLTLAAPGGPVNILCIQRTLGHGFWAGIAVGLGAVVGDGLIALIAASGLSFVAALLQTFAAEIQLIGGAILIVFGLKLTHNRLGGTRPRDMLDDMDAATDPAQQTLRSHAYIIPQSFLLTVTNPGAMLGAFALFGGLASVVGAMPTAADVAMVVFAVIAGNLTWWIVLSHTICRFRHRVDGTRLRTVNKYAGLALMAFGLLLLLRGGITFDLGRLAARANDLIAASGVA